MKRSVLPATLLALLIAGSLSACLPTGPGARETAQSFLEVLSSGDGAAAIALTTSDESDFGCAELEPSIAGAELGDVVEDGDSAIAKVTYAVFGEPVSESLELSRQSGEWKVELPDSYRVTVPIEQDVVVEATVEDDCIVQAVDGEIDFLALPGFYSVVLRDPTGVFSASSLGYAAVPLEETVSFIEGDEDYIKQIDRDIAANQLQVPINDAVYSCIESGFTNSDCPEGLPSADETQNLERPFELVSGDPRADDISAVDGKTWRFTTTTQTMRIQVNGVLTDVTFSYSGVITVDESGDLVPLLD